jgi:hypothetical protein
MRKTEQSPSTSPSIVPDTYLVLEDFGAKLGRAWRETDAEATTMRR